MHQKRHIASLIALAALATITSPGARAQAVWRCGNSYADQPCEGGRPIDAADERTPAQRLQAEGAARSEARLAGAMESDRLRQQRAADRALAAEARARQKSERDAAWQQALQFDDAEPVQPPRVFIARVPKAGKAAEPARKR